jgi:hypothetical protein
MGDKMFVILSGSVGIYFRKSLEDVEKEALYSQQVNIMDYDTFDQIIKNINCPIVNQYRHELF